MTSATISPAAFTGFDPWIGPDYGRDSDRPRVMILGESHYGKDEWRRADFTQEVVRYHVFQRRDRFFTKITKLVDGVGAGTYLPTPQYHAFWNRVIFWNYIQDLAGPLPRYRPSEEKWATGAAPFLRLVETHAPDIVVALGKELWAHLPAAARQESRTDASGRPFDVRFYDAAGSHSAVTWVNHPSSRGWRYEDWQPRVTSLLSSVSRT